MEHKQEAPHQAAYHIERLLRFAERQGLLEKLDTVAARNALLDLLKIGEPYSGELPGEALDSPAELLEPLLDYAWEAGLLEANTATCRDLLDARIMGLLLPRPAETARGFWSRAAADGPEAATTAFYKQSIASNYIRMDRIGKNAYWLADTAYGKLEMTVNLSKPEKDPKEIALLQTKAPSSYPSCLLCLDNVGYAGRLDHPARQHLRVIPLELDGEPWYFQYSPYVYYNEHSIVFHERHIPMKMTARTLHRLLEFVERFPHYFIGSNADLPIVGGSILHHDHFQAGRHRFAMELAAVEARFAHPSHPGVEAAIVRWPLSVIRLSGADKLAVYRLGAKLLDDWRAYSDPAAAIWAHSEADGERIPHNTMTPIARINARGQFELDVVLRNNRTSEERPDGIFHPRPALHHIKKENIGLIEVMGLAILPGRLQLELGHIGRLLEGEAAADIAGVRQDLAHPLHKHADWIEALLGKYGTRLTHAAAVKALQAEAGAKFLEVLLDAGVFKRTESGQQAFRTFLAKSGLAPV